MKWNDLTKEEQDFLLELDREYPMPDGATHFGVEDPSYSTWMILTSVSWYTYMNDKWVVYAPMESELRDFIQIPDKPWCCPEDNYPKDVSLNKPVSNEPSGSSNSYYWIEIPLDRVKIDEEKGVVGFMLEQYLKYGLDNDFDRCNLAKANHRIGRKGNSKEYEIGKMHYYVDQIDKNFEEDV